MVQAVGQSANFEESYVDVTITDSAGNHFNQLVVDQGFYLCAGQPALVAKSLRLESNTYMEGPGQMIVQDTLNAHPYSHLYMGYMVLRGVMADSGQFQPDTTTWAGTNQFMPSVVDPINSNIYYNQVIVAGPGLRAYDPSVNYDLMGSLRILNGASLRVGDATAATTMWIGGVLSTEGSGTFAMKDHAATLVNVYNDSVYFAGGSTAGLLTKGQLYVGGHFRQAGNAQSYSADKGHLTYFGSNTHTITFQNPGFGASHFGDLKVNYDNLLFMTDGFAAGSLVHAPSSYEGYLTSTTNQLLTTRGANASNVVFTGLRWKIVGGDSVVALASIDFMDMTPTSTYFTLARGGSGGGMPPLSNWHFNVIPTGAGRYMEIADTTANADVLTVNVTNVTPGGHNNKVNVLGGAILNGWPATFAWTGAVSTDWGDTLNWTTHRLPYNPDDIVIPLSAANNPVMSNYAYVHNLTIEAGRSIAVTGSYLRVQGDVVAPLTNTAITGCTGAFIVEGTDIVHSVVGKFCQLVVQGTYKISGPGNQVVTENGTLVNWGGDLNINGGRLDVGGVGGTDPSATFTTANGSTFTMMNAADTVFVGGGGGGANLLGGSTAGKLTAGTLIMTTGLLRGDGGVGVAAFAPSGTHTVVMSGNSYVNFGDPTVNFFQNLTLSPTVTLMLQTDMTVKGTLARGSGSGGNIIRSWDTTPHVLTTSGLSFSSAFATNVQTISLAFNDGTPNATFDNVTFVGFPGAFSGSIVNSYRTGAAMTFTNWNFGAAGFSASGAAHFLSNWGTADITLVSPTPSGGAVVAGQTWQQSNANTVHWP